MIGRWQYLPAWLMYSLIGLLNIPLSVWYRLTPAHLILANPSLDWGGMQIASKTKIMERFSLRPQYLKQVLLPVRAGAQKNMEDSARFMHSEQLNFPMVAKPDCGCVGFGVRVVKNEKELRAILEVAPVDYMLQEYAAHRQEFGIFFSKRPGEPQGSITGLTHKEIPRVVGDGQSNVRELMEKDSRFAHNRAAVLAHARGLDRVPAAGKEVELLVQASHTYGAWFTDYSAKVTPELKAWVNTFMDSDPEIRHGRMDVRAASLGAVLSGDGAAVIEFNGCMSEPIHVYDDRHSFWFGLSTFFQTYRDAYRAARANKGKKPIRVRDMYAAYRAFFRNKQLVMKQIG